jgi:Na+/H+ antiporter NhaD/arsenite permease-like protein
VASKKGFKKSRKLISEKFTDSSCDEIMPLEFVFFGLTLLGVAIFHYRALTVALTGLAATVAYKLALTGFKEEAGLPGLVLHFGHEWVTLANLMLLLVGFAILAHHFEESNVPHAIPRLLPDGWCGGLVLLALVFCMSAFLDNIAAAVIGGVVARHVYGGKPGIGFLASIVAAANAGGAGSVVGDTTTTMMWLAGISPLLLLSAFIPSIAAFIAFAMLGALHQHRHAPIMRHASARLEIDWGHVVVVVVVLISILGTNIVTNLYAPGLEKLVPTLGLAVWITILLALVVRQPDWRVAPAAAKGALFLSALVAIASLMPVEHLPSPSWVSVFGLGLLSSVFDNIPLSALALEQGGYDWPLLAYAVGFGGSMVWFGSSAGVALGGSFPEARSVTAWLRHGWHVGVAYVVGFFVMLALRGWASAAG